MDKQMLYNEDSRQAILRGVEKLSNAVKVTLGPKGRNVVIKKIGSPLVTKDGVTVANEINLKDDFEDMGAQLVKEVAEKTSDIAGDGTTTATILAEAIFREGIKHITSGANPMDIKRGMDKALITINKKIESMSKPINNSNEIAQVGTIASNGDKDIGKIISNAMEKVGKDGVITIESAQSINTTLEVVEGMQFDNGYISPYFAGKDKEVIELIEPYILFYEGEVANIKEIMGLLEKVKNSKRPILFISDSISGEVLPILIINSVQGVVKNCCVRAPYHANRRKMAMSDMAVLTGGAYIDKDLGVKLEAINLQYLGQAEKVIITKDDTTIINGKGTEEKINKRIEQIKSKLESVDADYDKDLLKERIAKLISGIAIIKVGAITEAEMLEKKARVEDALNATRAAVEDGIIAGGGVALLRCIDDLSDLKLDGDENIAITILKNALEIPIKQIAKNAGTDSSVITQKIKENPDVNFGYDAKTNKFVNMIDAGIIDPAKVTKTALQNAASIASLMFTTEVLITDLNESDTKKDANIVY